MLPVHKIDLQQFKAARLRVKRLNRDPQIISQDRLARRDIIMEEEKKEDEN